MKVKSPCPHCGDLFMCTVKWIATKDGPLKVHDIDEHRCRAFREETPITGTTDTTFMREAWNTDVGMDNYRRSLR